MLLPLSTSSSIRLLVNGLVLGFFCQTIAAQSTSSQWPSFLGPNRDGISNLTNIQTDWSDGKLKVRWRHKIQRGYVLGAECDSFFFQFDAIDKQCRLICRNAESGESVWKFEYPFEYSDTFGFDSGPRATPAIDNGLVYIYGVEGMLHCLDIKTGEVIWKLDVNKKYGVVQNFFGVGSSPLVVGDKLLLMVGGSPEKFQNLTNGRLDTVKPNGTGVVALNKKTGREIYTLGNDLASYSSIKTYSSGDKMNAVAWMRNDAIGFDIETGKELWSYPYRSRRYETVNASTPVTKNQQIFLSESYGPGSILLDVSKQEPEVVWNDTNPRKRSLATHWNTPVLHQGHLYGCHGEGSANSQLRCVEWATGKVKWKQGGYGRSSLTYVDGHLVVLDERGPLHLIKATPESYQLVSKYSDEQGSDLKLKSPCWSAPVIANGNLYVRGKNQLVCLQLKKP